MAGLRAAGQILLLSRVELVFFMETAALAFLQVAPQRELRARPPLEAAGRLARLQILARKHPALVRAVKFASGLGKGIGNEQDIRHR
jgi:hypothetical protein